MRILTALLTLIVLAACGDDVADLRDVDFVMVSGDGQAATVNLDAGASGDAVPMVVAGDEYFPGALVARFVVDGTGGIVVPTGASPVVLPNNLEADWYVAHDGQRCTDPVACGGPVNGTTLPNDSGYVDNLWRTPTVAGEYEMWAEAVSGDSVLRQLVYTGTVNPGPPVFPDAGVWATHFYAMTDGWARFPVLHDANGNDSGRYFVDPTGAWLEALGGSIGTDSARTVVKTGTAHEGDTATVRFLAADSSVICDCLATLDSVNVNDQANDTIYTTWRLVATAKPSN